MKRLAIALLAVIPVSALIALGLYTYPRFVAQPPVITYAQPVQQPETIKLNADTIFELVNAERVKNGLQPLIRDARLDASAQTKADDMAINNYFAHINPTTGVNGYTLIPLELCSYQSENLNAALDNEETVAEWMDSEPHKNAILDSQYDISGIGVAWHGKYYVITQHFCNLK